MKLNTILRIYAGTAMVFCIGLLTLPEFWIRLYGAHDDPQAILLLRLAGALFGGIAVMAWVSRNAGPSQSRDAIVLGFAVSNGLAAAVAVLGALSGVYNQFAWGPVATFTVFAIGFMLVERKSLPAPTPR